MLIGQSADAPHLSHHLSSQYLDLIRNWELWNSPLDSALRLIAEFSTRALNLQRAGIWAFSEDRRSLTLLCQFDRQHGEFSHGAEINQRTYPHYFASIESQRLIDANDLSQDPRTSELTQSYAAAGNITALLDAGVRLQGNTWGVLCNEHDGSPRLWTGPEKWFAVSVADLISQLLVVSEVRDNEARMRLIADNLPVGILRIDTDARCLYVNSRWLELAAPGDGAPLQGQSWLNALHVDDRAPMLAQLNSAWQQQTERIETECRFLVQGRQRWLAVRWVIERDPSGFPLGALGSFADETARRQSLEQLREISTLQHAILNGANHIIIATDERGIINSYNRAAERMLGYSAQEVIGRFTPALFHDPGEMAWRGAELSTKLGRPLSSVFEMFAAGPGEESHEREWTLVRKDGSRFPVLLSVTALRDADGRISGYVGIGADLTDQRRAEEIAQREQALILRITNGLAAATGDQFFITLTHQLAEALDVDYAFVGELLPGTPARVRTIAAHYRGRTSTDDALYSVPDTPLEPIFRDGHYACAEGARRAWPRDSHLAANPVESFLGVALHSAAGAQLGVLTVSNGEALPNLELARNLLRIFAVRAASELERRRQEMELRDSERRYRALFENSDDAIFLMESDRLVDCNERTLAMFAGTRAQLIGQAPYRLSPEMQPDGSPSKARMLARIASAARGRRQNFDWQCLRRDGTAFDAEMTLTSIVLGGRPYLLATVRDISDRKQAERALKSSNERLRWINQVATRLYGKRDIASIAREGAALLSDHNSLPLVSFYLYEPHPSRVTFLAEHGNGRKTARVVGTRYPCPDIPADVEEVDFVADVPRNFTRFPAEQRALVARGVKDIVTITLKYDGAVLGLVTLDYLQSIQFGADERADLRAFGKTVSMALANARYVADMEHQANFDALTALPNRYALHRELAQQLQTHGEQPLALLLLDLDRFKEVNDTLGHDVGDKLLRSIGMRLEGSLADQSGFLARLGGDEFAVILHQPGDENALRNFARQMLAVLKQPFSVDGLALEIGASIGISLYPAHGRNAHELLRSADVAMYAAKHRQAGSLIYSSALDQHSPDRLALLAELGSAIHNGELRVYYQPKIAIADGGVVGFEALVRWSHPRRGLLQPGEFIPAAEMSDTIHPLTMEVLRQALVQQQRWRAANLPHAISVNISARNLIEEHFVEQLQTLMRQLGADPAALELEITESALMQDPEGAADMLRRIAALGVQLSIDDFGMGYSSMAYLRRLPINALKIDRTYVTDMAANEQDAIIVRSTINLAHNLGLKVVAEGVEDADALALLRQMHCEFAQGYHISRPLPADAATDAIAVIGARLGVDNN